MQTYKYANIQKRKYTKTQKQEIALKRICGFAYATTYACSVYSATLIRMGVEKDPPLFFLSYFAFFLVFLCFSFGISCVWASNLTIINAIALSHGT